ncbi:hypothetical protein Pint_20794 [Pistacia integerrima]|uniref:Uncharacterized protein n=1 Tax=Pistacia integerrima TaxID=434235 RepID=A0ACC0XAX0_9ROSI|nr:hypothetical protein Pint_20794 [Pistacia integerrima]
MLSISRPVIKVPDKEGREANHEGEKHPFEGGNSPIILLRDFEDKEEKSPVSIISGKGSKQGRDISKSVDGFGKETWPFFILGYDTKILPEDISNRRLGLRPLDVLTIMLKKLGMDMEKCVPGQNSLLCPARKQKSKEVAAVSWDDEEANEDLSLKIVEKHLLMRAAKLVQNDADDNNDVVLDDEKNVDLSSSSAKQDYDNGKSNGKAGESDVIDVEFEEFCKAIEANLSIEQMVEILEANDQDSSGPDPVVVTKCQDMLFYGLLGRCPIFSSELEFDGKRYTCKGMYKDKGSEDNHNQNNNNNAENNNATMDSCGEDCVEAVTVEKAGECLSCYMFEETSEEA